MIWCAELKDNLKEIKEETLTQCVEATEPWELVFGKVAEGPSIVKQDGLYYMFYSANDFRSQDYAVGYATSVRGGKAKKIRFCIKWKNLSEPVMVHHSWTDRADTAIFSMPIRVGQK